MIPDPDDPKVIIARGYDAIAERYLAWSATVRVAERERYTRLLLDALSAGAAVLELGCGAGIPTTKRLAARFAVTGVDLSPRQVALARANVPDAAFMIGDMTSLPFPKQTFDAVCAFYAITHVPRDEHAGLLARITAWLQPGGLFVASFSTGGTAGAIEDNWHGTPMYFSGYDAETNQCLVRDAGLVITSARVETDMEFGRPTPFLWIVAQKPRLGQ
ncbi:MAG: class I SAM-dependent methyltransferase [Chloroflexota bacterium]|nr:class I SAM-dependent methyltransferase [Chloroflexota bacterium]